MTDCFWTLPSFLSPLLGQVAFTVEEHVTASAPGVAMKLNEAAVLVDQAGEQTAQQVQVGGAGLRMCTARRLLHCEQRL